MAVYRSSSRIFVFVNIVVRVVCVCVCSLIEHKHLGSAWLHGAQWVKKCTYEFLPTEGVGCC